MFATADCPTTSVALIVATELPIARFR